MGVNPPIADVPEGGPETTWWPDTFGRTDPILSTMVADLRLGLSEIGSKTPRIGMKLEGGERMVLKALRELQGDSTDYVKMPAWPPPSRW